MDSELPNFYFDLFVYHFLPLFLPILRLPAAAAARRWHGRYNMLFDLPLIDTDTFLKAKVPLQFICTTVVNGQIRRSAVQ